MISPRNVDGSLPSDGVPFSILPAENNTVCCWDGIMAFLTSENWLVGSVANAGYIDFKIK